MPFFIRQLQQPIHPLPTGDPTYDATMVTLMLLQVAIAAIGAGIMVIAALREIIPALIHRWSSSRKTTIR